MYELIWLICCSGNQGFMVQVLAFFLYIAVSFSVSLEVPLPDKVACYVHSFINIRGNRE